jgi:hypothetical protein
LNRLASSSCASPPAPEIERQYTIFTWPGASGGNVGAVVGTGEAAAGALVAAAGAAAGGTCVAAAGTLVAGAFVATAGTAVGGTCVAGAAQPLASTPTSAISTSTIRICLFISSSFEE